MRCESVNHHNTTLLQAHKLKLFIPYMPRSEEDTVIALAKNESQSELAVTNNRAKESLKLESHDQKPRCRNVFLTFF